MNKKTTTTTLLFSKAPRSRRRCRSLLLRSSLLPWTPVVVLSSVLLLLCSMAAIVSGAGDSATTTTTKTVVSSVEDFPYDENGHLANHLLVYAADGACGDLVEDYFETKYYVPSGFELFALRGDAMEQYFGSSGVVRNPPTQRLRRSSVMDQNNSSDAVASPTSVDDCRAVCVERGVEKSLVASAMPIRRYDERASFKDWFTTRCEKVEVCFMNYIDRDAPLNMYWYHLSKQKWQFQRQLEYGERKTACIESFLGHKFKFEDGPTNGEAYSKTLTVEFTAIISNGEAPNHYKGETPVSEIERALGTEWHKHNSVSRTFSGLGFRKGRLPDDLFASMGAFYYNNRNNRVREEWVGKGFFVNWWETDVYFIQIPWRLKQLWQGRLLGLVEAWLGGKIPLEQTDMYGLRRYEEGARLLTHVDRRPTHAASLIVNIAQGGVVEPWPVEIHDHANRLHQIAMEPGDIVYYESAKCLHGRNTPLTGAGAHYVNLFTHYRPVDDPDWYRRENSETTPEPVLDVGDCWINEENDASPQRNKYENAVRYENPSIGPYLSPHMFTATSGDDLFNYWKEVGPISNSIDGEMDEF